MVRYVRMYDEIQTYSIGVKQYRIFPDPYITYQTTNPFHLAPTCYSRIVMGQDHLEFRDNSTRWVLAFFFSRTRKKIACQYIRRRRVLTQCKQLEGHCWGTGKKPEKEKRTELLRKTT